MSTNIMISRIKEPQTAERSLQYQNLLRPEGQSLRQYFNHTLFSTATGLKGGAKVDATLEFNSNQTELDRQHYVKFDVDTTDGTNHPTFLDDSRTLIDSVELQINDSAERLKMEGQIPIRLQSSHEFRSNADRISQKRSSSDVNWNTLTGVQVTDAATQTFYFSIFDIFPQIKNLPMGKLIRKIKCTIRFAPYPTNAADACTICLSNTTSNAYTSAVTFNNVTYVRVFDIVKDDRTISIPLLQNVTLPVPYYEERRVSNVSWTTVGTDRYKFQLNDMFSLVNVQEIIVFIRENGQAYNDASSSQMHYGGYNYIKWRVAEKFGNRKELSFLATSEDSTRRLRNFEIDYQYRQFGDDLPLEFYTNSTVMNRTIFSNATVIPFNMIRNEDPQNVKLLTNLDTSKSYYEIELECAGSVGADSDIYIVAKTFNEYKFNDNFQIVKVGGN